MAVRTDVHRPSAPEFDPADYEDLAGYDFNPEWPGVNGDASRLIQRLTTEGVRFSGVHGGGRCDHCGARLRYAALLRHRPTNTLIWVGERCLDGRFELSASEFTRLRKAGRLNRERQAKAAKIEQLVDEHPLLAELTYEQALEEASDFVWDVAFKFRRYGELSERQIEAVERAILRDVEWRERRVRWDTERAVEDAAAEDAPSGKTEVTGTVLSTKWKDHEFGSTLKMTVKDDRGFRVWVSVPKSIHVNGEPRNGDRVRLVATLRPSDDDPKFAFGSRPTKGEVLA